MARKYAGSPLTTVLAQTALLELATLLEAWPRRILHGLQPRALKELPSGTVLVAGHLVEVLEGGLTLVLSARAPGVMKCKHGAARQRPSTRRLLRWRTRLWS